MTGLFLNFFECNFLQARYSLKTLSYTDYDTKEKYFRLIDRHKDFAFTRNGEDIYYWKLDEQAIDNLGGQISIISAHENPRVFLKVLETAIIYRLRTVAGYEIRHDKFSHVWKVTSVKDLFDSSIQGMTLHQQIGFNTFYRHTDGKFSFGVVISTDIEHQFTWGKKEFERNGIDTQSLDFEEDTIFPNRHAIKQFLIASGTEEEYGKRVKRINSNSQKMEVISRFYSWINSIKDSLYLPDTNKLTSISKKYLPYSELKQEVFSSPIRYYFGGKQNEQTGLYYNQQVKRYKPFSFELFDEKTVKIGILCPKQFEGVTEGFINRLEAILRNELHLRKVKFIPCFIKDATESSYRENLYNLELQRCEVIIIVVTEDHKKLPTKRSPYFICKAKFIGNGIPTQDVQINNIKNCNQFILNNIALNIYAKLGGTAWTIEKEEKRKQELIIGIGSTSNDEGTQVLGIAQVFNSDGRYLVGECAPLSNFDNYVENLRGYLLRTLTKVVDDHIDKTQEFRLIFHLYKSASSRYEIRAINDVIKEFDELSFKYALLHIGYGHNFRLFYDEGRQSVARGMYLKLDDNSAVLHFVPDNCLPLYIQLDKRSTFQDLYYLSKQIFWFSNLSHRSYIPAKRTVTITYPSLMASITEKLKQVDGWDYDRLANVADKLWFI